MADLTYEQIVVDIQARNYFEVAFPLGKADVESVARDFLEFLTLPQAIKDSFTIIIDPDDRGSNAGYARKERAKGESDNKEYFNYRAVTRRVLERQLRDNAGNSKVENFITSADRLFNESVLVLKQIIGVVDSRYPGIYGKIFGADIDRLLALRFVKYDPAYKGQLLATAHYDRGSCALAIGESAPGLRVGRDEASLKEVVRHGDTAIFMPAFTFNTDVGSTEFTPTWHDVVQKSDAVYSADVARWAIILFADVHKQAEITYADSHTPLLG